MKVSKVVPCLNEFRAIETIIKKIVNVNLKLAGDLK